MQKKLSGKSGNECWVVNASPVICLAKAGQIEILLNLPEKIIIPNAVAEEIHAGPSGDPARQILSLGKFMIVEVMTLPKLLPGI